MNAFQAAKRITVTLLALLLLLPGVSARAGQDEGWLGVYLQDISPSMAKALRLDDAEGVLVDRVVDDGPAQKAGLQDGDVIIEFDGKAVSESKELTAAVRQASPGDSVAVVVLRDGKKQRLEVELGEREDREYLAQSLDKLKGLKWIGKEGKALRLEDDGDLRELMIERMHTDPDRGFLGVHLDDLNSQLGEYFGVDEGRGALITEIVDDSPAAATGLKAGDVIVKINDRDVGSAAELQETLDGTKPGDEVKIQAVRHGDREKFKITLGEVPEQEIGGNVMFFGDDDGQYTLRAPKMMWRGAPDGSHKLIQRYRLPHDEEATVIIREKSEEMDQLHEELQKMKKELEALKKELHK